MSSRFSNVNSAPKAEAKAEAEPYDDLAVRKARYLHSHYCRIVQGKTVSNPRICILSQNPLFNSVVFVLCNAYAYVRGDDRLPMYNVDFAIQATISRSVDGIYNGSWIPVLFTNVSYSVLFCVINTILFFSYLSNNVLNCIFFYFLRIFVLFIVIECSLGLILLSFLSRHHLS